ncbi:unnamed protein product [Toxocara canis]|uniref:T-complex protein 11-like protein 1 n=1 Tax=Toxocara canis TaxID=6265 RepID=A0A183UP94_TOXCA|nr:unnamed protein product [Toxocara canis]
MTSFDEGTVQKEMPLEEEGKNAQDNEDKDSGNAMASSASEDDHNISQPSSSSGQQLKRKWAQSDSMPIEGVEMNQFPSWVAGGSPAKFIDREQLMNMSSALENMALVHEVSLDSNFAFSTTPPDPMTKAVKECVHRAFWDQMREDVSKDPPDYTQAFEVLLDIKKMILEVIPDDRVRLRSEVDAELDETLLRQQLDEGCLDVNRISTYLLDLIGRLCAPCRDEELKKIHGIENIVDILRSICEILEETKVDMANFYVRQNHALIKASSAEYELAQFMKVMEADPGIRLTIREWLVRHIDDGNESGSNESASPSHKKRYEELSSSEVSAIISRAYLELLEWDVRNPYPSTFMFSFMREVLFFIMFEMDRCRLEALSEKLLQLIVCTSCVLITCNMAGREVSELTGFKVALKNQLLIITNDIERSNIKELLELVFAQCEKNVVKCYEELKCDKWTGEKKTELHAQIVAVADPNNHVRKLMQSRMNSFILSMISNDSSSTAHRLPVGVSMVERELKAVTALFTRIVSHNRATFGALYGQLLKEALTE